MPWNSELTTPSTSVISSPTSSRRDLAKSTTSSAMSKRSFQRSRKLLIAAHGSVNRHTTKTTTHFPTATITITTIFTTKATILQTQYTAHLTTVVTIQVTTFTTTHTSQQSHLLQHRHHQLHDCSTQVCWSWLTHCST